MRSHAVVRLWEVVSLVDRAGAVHFGDALERPHRRAELQIQTGNLCQANNGVSPNQATHRPMLGPVRRHPLSNIAPPDYALHSADLDRPRADTRSLPPPHFPAHQARAHIDIRSGFDLRPSLVPRQAKSIWPLRYNLAACLRRTRALVPIGPGPGVNLNLQPFLESARPQTVEQDHPDLGAATPHKSIVLAGILVAQPPKKARAHEISLAEHPGQTCRNPQAMPAPPPNHGQLRSEKARLPAHYFVERHFPTDS